MDFRRMKQTAAAAALGITRQTLASWTQKGCPRNDDSSYSLPEIFAWSVEQAKGETRTASTPEADLWLTEFRKERALLARLDREEREGELVPRQDLAKAWAARVTEVTSAFNNFVDRFPPLLLGKSRNEMRQILDDEFHQLRERYSRPGRFCPPSENMQ